MPPRHLNGLVGHASALASLAFLASCGLSETQQRLNSRTAYWRSVVETELPGPRRASSKLGSTGGFADLTGQCLILASTRSLSSLRP